MAVYNGKNYTKADLLRRLGNISGIAGVRSCEILNGKANTVKIHEVRAGELEYTLMETACLDPLEVRYKGYPLSFLSKSGPVNRASAEPIGTNFMYSLAGGMMYTCGFGNVGVAYESAEGIDYNQGRMRWEPADKVKVYGEWEGDEYLVGVGGEMRETALFHSNCALRRTVLSHLGSKTIEIKDEIENESYLDHPFMVLYHLNFGYPLVDEGLKVHVPKSSYIALNPAAKEIEDKWDVVTAPNEEAKESVFIHHTLADKEGMTHCGIYNEKLGIGVEIIYNRDLLPDLAEWHSMISGDYVFGLQPHNNLLSGRQKEIDNGTLKLIKPFETIHSGVTLKVLDGEEDYKAFLERVEACKY
ncbi:MAG: DUF4432 family protein [Ruminococcaceae bacterium]|nr:DUF4432 family protein [Oscillospiraceae bacterium]